MEAAAGRFQSARGFGHCVVFNLRVYFFSCYCCFFLETSNCISQLQLGRCTLRTNVLAFVVAQEHRKWGREQNGIAVPVLCWYNQGVSVAEGSWKFGFTIWPLCWYVQRFFSWSLTEISSQNVHWGPYCRENESSGLLQRCMASLTGSVWSDQTELTLTADEWWQQLQISPIIYWLVMGGSICRNLLQPEALGWIL